MSRYAKVERRIWCDAKFLSLEQDAKFLFLYLLTTDHATCLPGLLKLGLAQVAEALEWLPERLAKGFGELFRKGLVKADWRARVVWLPNAIRYNAPENPNVVKGWVTHWDLVPECGLKDEAFVAYSQTLEGLGKPFLKPFLERCRNGIGNGIGNGMPNQDPDPEPDPYPDQRSSGAPQATPESGETSDLNAQPAEPPPTPPKPVRKRPPREPNPETEGHRAVKAEYIRSYEIHRGAKPPFGARDAVAINTLLSKVGGDHERACKIVREAYDKRYFGETASIALIAADPARFEGASGQTRPVLAPGTRMSREQAVREGSADKQTKLFGQHEEYSGNNDERSVSDGTNAAR